MEDVDVGLHVAALASSRAPTLVVEGTADRTSDSEFICNLASVEGLEIEDADPMLQHPRDLERSIDVLQVLTHHIGRLAGRLSW